MNLSYIKENTKHYKVAFNMAWPAVLESFFIALAGMVDSLMVSSIGAYAVAAVGLTTQPKFIGLALFIAINVSVSALVARRKGEDDRYSANQVLLFAMALTVVAGIVISILCVVFADTIIKISGSASETHGSAVVYFRIIMGCMIFNIISLVINAAQRGAGNTKVSMKTNLTANVVNMIGNFLLINGNFGFPAWGIVGAAIATVIGTVIACFMSIKSLFNKNNFISFYYMKEANVKLSFAPAKIITKIGGSAFVEQLLLRAGFMAVSVMAAHQGTSAMAAQQVGMNVMSLSFSFGEGMQIAAVTLIGQSLGKKDPQMAKKYGSICQRMGFIIAIVLSVTYLIFGKLIYELFFTETHIIAIGVIIMRIMVVIVIMQIPQVIYMGCLRGAGDVVFTAIASTISVTFLRPIASFLFCYVLGIGLPGIWLGIVADQACRLILTTWRFKSGRWTKIKI